MSILLCKVLIRCLHYRRACWLWRLQHRLTIEPLTAIVSFRMVLKTCETREGVAHVGLLQLRVRQWLTFAFQRQAVMPFTVALIATRSQWLKLWLATVGSVVATEAMQDPLEVSGMVGACRASQRSGIHCTCVVVVTPASTSMYRPLHVKAPLGAGLVPTQVNRWQFGISLVLKAYVVRKACGSG